MEEKIFVGKKFPANQKIVWDTECRKVFFCYHCGLPILSTEEMPENFKCPKCGCPYFQTEAEKIQEEKDIQKFMEQVEKSNLTWKEAEKIAEMEAIKHIPKHD